MADEYPIRTIADFFAVPIDRRSAMFRDIEYGMALAELAYGDKAADAFSCGTWRDDGDHHVTLSVNGELLLSLNVETGPRQGGVES